jgi:hypothetical protein
VLQQLVNKENEAGEEEGTMATMANVEEMLEEYEWASDDIIDRKIGTGAGGAADLIEARLLNELTALEKVSFVKPIFAILRMLTSHARQTYTLFWSETTG